MGIVRSCSVWLRGGSVCSAARPLVSSKSVVLARTRFLRLFRRNGHIAMASGAALTAHYLRVVKIIMDSRRLHRLFGWYRLFWEMGEVDASCTWRRRDKRDEAKR